MEIMGKYKPWLKYNQYGEERLHSIGWNKSDKKQKQWKEFTTNTNYIKTI
jgi:hypothetical protein